MTTTSTSTPVSANTQSENWLVVNATDASSAQNKSTQISAGTIKVSNDNTYHANVADISKFFNGTGTLQADADHNTRYFTVDQMSGFRAGDSLAIIEGINANAYGQTYTTDGYVTENLKISAVGTTKTSGITSYFPFFMGTVTSGASGIANVYYVPSLTSSTPVLANANQSISAIGLSANTTITTDLTDTSMYTGGANNSVALTGVSASSTSTTLTVATIPASVVAGLGISGSKIPAGTVITVVGSGSLTISNPTTGSISSGTATVSGLVISSNATATSDGTIISLGASSTSSTIVAPIASITSSTASTAGTTVTVTTTVAHNLNTGDSIVISGVSPSGYNGTFTISVISKTIFSYFSSATLTNPTLSSALVTRATTSPISAISASGATSSAISTVGTNAGNGINQIALDSSGNIFSTDASSNTVWKMTPAGVVTSYSTAVTSPYGITFDSAGNLYVGSTTANNVYKVTPQGINVNVTNIVPSGSSYGKATFASGLTGNHGGAPYGLSKDSAGNFYTTAMNTVGTSPQNDQVIVYKVTPTGTVSTFHQHTFTTNTINAHGCYDTAVDPSGNVYLTSVDGNVYKIDSTGTTFSTFANGINTGGNMSFIIYEPVSNCFYVSSYTTAFLYKITLAGAVTQFGTIPLYSGYGNQSLLFNLVADSYGNVYTIDAFGGITKTTPSGTTTTILPAQNNPYAGVWMTIDSSNTLYVADNADSAFYSVNSTTGAVNLISASYAYGRMVYSGGFIYQADASSTGGLMYKITLPANILATVTTASPHGLTTGQAVTVATNSVSTYNGTWTITVTGTSTFTYTTPTLGASTGTGGTVSFGSPSTVSTFATGLNTPVALAWDNAGAYLYISNQGNNTISRVSSSGGASSVFCSSGVNSPASLAWDSAGTTLYVASATSGGIISKVNTSGVATTWTNLPSSDILTSIAFNSAKTNIYALSLGGSVYQIPVSSGTLSLYSTVGAFNPNSIAVDSSGSVYVSEPSDNAKILKIASSTTNTVTVTTSSANSFATGDSIVISGVTSSPSGYTGTFTITAVDSTHFKYTTTTLPGTATLSSATATKTISTPLLTVSPSASSANYLANVTTNINHGFLTGEVATISGTTTSGYLGNFPITVTGNTTFTYPIPASYSSSTGGYATVSGISASASLSAGSTASLTSISGTTGVATAITTATNSFTTNQSVTIAGNTYATTIASVTGSMAGTTPTTGVATFTTGVSFSGKATSASTTISSIPDTTGLIVGNTITGNNLASGTTISSITPSSGATPGSLVMNNPAVGSTATGATDTFTALQVAPYSAGSVVSITAGGSNYSIANVKGATPTTGNVLLTTTKPFGTQVITGQKVSISGIPELSGSITSATGNYQAGTVTVTTSAPHNLVNNDTVTTTFASANGSIAQISGDGTTATVTTQNAHGLVPGQSVVIDGVSSQTGSISQTAQIGNTILVYFNGAPNPALVAGDTLSIAQAGATLSSSPTTYTIPSGYNSVSINNTSVTCRTSQAPLFQVGQTVNVVLNFSSTASTTSYTIPTSTTSVGISGTTITVKTSTPPTFHTGASLNIGYTFYNADGSVYKTFNDTGTVVNVYATSFTYTTSYSTAIGYSIGYSSTQAGQLTVTDSNYSNTVTDSGAITQVTGTGFTYTTAQSGNIGYSIGYNSTQSGTASSKTTTGGLTGTFAISSVNAPSSGSGTANLINPNSPASQNGNVNYVSNMGADTQYESWLDITNGSTLVTDNTITITQTIRSGSISRVKESGGVLTVTTSSAHGLTASGSFYGKSGTQTFYQTVDLSIPVVTSSAPASISSITASGTNATATSSQVSELATGDTIFISGVGSTSSGITLATQNKTQAVGITAYGGNLSQSGGSKTISAMHNTNSSSIQTSSGATGFNTIAISLSTAFSPVPVVGEVFTISGTSSIFDGKTYTVVSASNNAISATTTGLTTYKNLGAVGSVTIGRVFVSTNQAHGFTTGQSITVSGSNVTAYNGTKTNIQVTGTNSFYWPGFASGTNTATVKIYSGTSTTNPAYVSPAWSDGGSIRTYSTYPTPHGFSAGQTVSITGLKYGTGLNDGVPISQIYGDNFNTCVATTNYVGLAVGSVVTIAGASLLNNGNPFTVTVTAVNTSTVSIGIYSVPAPSFTFNFAGGPSDNNFITSDYIYMYNVASGFNGSVTISSTPDSYTFITDNPGNVQTVPSGQTPSTTLSGTYPSIQDLNYISGSGQVSISNPFNGTFNVTGVNTSNNTFTYTLGSSYSGTVTGGTWYQPSAFTSLSAQKLISASGNTFTISAPPSLSGTGYEVDNLGTWTQPTGLGGSTTLGSGITQATDSTTFIETAYNGIGTIFGGTWTSGTGNTTYLNGGTWSQPTGWNTPSTQVGSQTVYLSNYTITSTPTPTTFTFALPNVVGTTVGSGTYLVQGSSLVGANVPVSVINSTSFSYPLGGVPNITVGAGTWATPVGFNSSSTSATIPQYSIYAISAPASGYSTVTLTGNHQFSGGETILISGNATFNGTYIINTATSGTAQFTIPSTAGSSATGGAVTSQSSFYYSNNTLGTTYGNSNSSVAVTSSVFNDTQAKIIASYNGGTQFSYANAGVGTAYTGTVSGSTGFNGKYTIASIVNPTTFTFNYSSGAITATGKPGLSGTATTSALASGSTSLYSVIPTPEAVGLGLDSSLVIPTDGSVTMESLRNILPDFFMATASSITYSAVDAISTITLENPTFDVVVGQTIMGGNGDFLGVVSSIVSSTQFLTTGSAGAVFPKASSSATSIYIHGATVNENHTVVLGPTIGGNIYTAQVSNPPYHGSETQRFIGASTAGSTTITGLANADATSLFSAILPSMAVSGQGIQDGTTVVSTDPTTNSVVLSKSVIYSALNPSCVGSTATNNSNLLNVNTVSGFFENSELSGTGISPATSVGGIYPQKIIFGNIQSGHPTVTSATDTNGLIVGQSFGGVSGIPAGAYIVGIDNNNNIITLNKNATATITNAEVWGLPAILSNIPTFVNTGTTITGKAIYTFGQSPIYFPININNYGGIDTIFVSGNTIIGKNIIDNISDTSNIYEGMYITGSNIAPKTFVTFVGTNYITLNHGALETASATLFSIYPRNSRLATFISMASSATATTSTTSSPILLGTQVSPGGISYGVVNGSVSMYTTDTSANIISSYTMPAGGYPLVPVAGLIAPGTTIISIDPNDMTLTIAQMLGEGSVRTAGVAGLGVNAQPTTKVHSGYKLTLNKPLIGNTKDMSNVYVSSFPTGGSYPAIMTVDDTSNFTSGQFIAFRNEIYQIASIFSSTQIGVAYPISNSSLLFVTPQEIYVSTVYGTISSGSSTIDISAINPDGSAGGVGGIVPGMLINDITGALFPPNTTILSVTSGSTMQISTSNPASTPSDAQTQFAIMYPNGDNPNYIYEWEGGIPKNTFVAPALSTDPTTNVSGYGILETEGGVLFPHAEGTPVGSFSNKGVRYFGSTSSGNFEAVNLDFVGSLTGSRLQQKAFSKDSSFTIAPNPTNKTNNGAGFTPLWPTFQGTVSPVLQTTLYSDLLGSPAVLSVPNNGASPTKGALAIGAMVDSPVTFTASITTGSNLVTLPVGSTTGLFSQGMYVFGDGIPENSQIVSFQDNSATTGIITFKLINGNQIDAIEQPKLFYANATKTNSMAQLTASWFPEGTTIATAIESSFSGDVAPTVAITSATYSSGVITYVTTTAHGFTAGDVVNISGIQPSGWNGNFTVAGVADNTHFTVNTTNSTTYEIPTSTSSVSINSTDVTVVTSTAPTFKTGATVYLSFVFYNADGSVYNTVNDNGTVTAVTTNGFTYTTTVPGNVGYSIGYSVSQGGTVTSSSSIASASTLTTTSSVTGAVVSPLQIKNVKNSGQIIEGVGIWSANTTGASRLLAPGTTITGINALTSGLYTITLSLPLNSTYALTGNNFQVQGYVTSAPSSYVPWSGIGISTNNSSATFNYAGGNRTALSNATGNALVSAPTNGAPVYGQGLPFGTKFTGFNSKTVVWSINGGTDVPTINNGTFVAGINIVASNLIEVLLPATGEDGAPASALALGAIGLATNAPISCYFNGQSTSSALGNIVSITSNSDGDIIALTLDKSIADYVDATGNFFSEAYGTVVVGSGTTQESLLLESPFSYSIVSQKSGGASPVQWALASGSQFQYDHEIGEPVVVPNILSTRVVN